MTEAAHPSVSRAAKGLTDTAHAQRPRVAVIAVHGVADQQPGDSAADVAGLLLSLPQYHAFHGSALHVPLHPVEISDRERARRSSAEAESAKAGPPSKVTRLRHSLSERRGYLAEGRAESRTAARASAARPAGSVEPNEAESLANDAMRLRLAGYAGTRDRSTYITTRLDGERSDGTRVDVFEMYWADLSRVAKGPLAFLGALYQLLLHLAELGRQAVDDAAYEHRDSRRWRWLSNLQAYAVRLLVLPIVLLNAILLCGSIAPVLARLLLGSPARIASAVLTGTIGLAAAYALFSKTNPGRRPSWATVPIASILLAGGAGYALASTVGVANLPVLVAVEWWLVAWALLHFVFRQFDRVRPGAFWVSHLLYLLCAVAFVASLIISDGPHRATYYPGATADPSSIVALGRVEQATLWTIQLVWVALRWLWFAMWFLVVATAILAYLTTFRVDRSKDAAADEARRSRARAALRTGRLALALSSLGILFVTIALWIGAFSYTAQKSDAFQCLAPTVVPLPESLTGLIQIPNPTVQASWLQTPGMPADSPCPGQPSIREYFRALFVLSVSTGLLVTLALAGAGLLLLVWMALPSVFTETRGATDRANGAAERMGAWLSRGLDTTSFVTWLFWIAIFVVPPVFVAGDYLARHHYLPTLIASRLHGLAILTVSAIGAIAAVTTSAALVIATVVKFGGSALDVMLDVDNYLRTLPEDGTPRARIVERYVSLLRYIVSVGVDTKDQVPYTAIVIVAHSLGALISADLLRFLKQEARNGARTGDASLTRLGYGPLGDGAEVPVYLFTMGNPLRQLLNRFFPHQYRWVREVPDNGLSPLPQKQPVDPVPAASGSPTPDQLGIRKWDSAYRSGDYVGRSLWLTEWYSRTRANDPADPFVFESADRRAEQCIGVGAHTHYWDRTAPEIASRVDVLVTLAASAARTGSPISPPGTSKVRQ